MPGVQLITVAEDESGWRLDRWFKRHFPDLAHGRLEKLLRTGQIRVDGSRAKAAQRLVAGQEIRVPPMPDGPAAPQPPTPAADDSLIADLTDAVLHRDDQVLVINKPPGLAVQGGTNTRRHVDAALDGLRFGATERPRLVHRLDKDTSGVLVLARGAAAARALTEAFRSRDAHKVYWAVTVGVPSPASGTVDLPLGKMPGKGGERMQVDHADGRQALTRYRVRDEALRRVALVELEPATGRTHQLRVHCAEMGTPILGDGKYGGPDAFLAGEDLPRRLHLHARRLQLPHPNGGMLDVTAPLPDHMRRTFAFFDFATGD